MKRQAVLVDTNNTYMKEYIGMKGTLEQNTEDSNFLFAMDSIGATIRTSTVKADDIDSGIYKDGLNNPDCNEYAFITNSGSYYSFEVEPMERLIEKKQKDNRSNFEK